MIRAIRPRYVIAPSSRRVQACWDIDVDPGRAAEVREAMAAVMSSPETLDALRELAARVQRGDLAPCPECGRPAGDPEPHKLRCGRRTDAGLALPADRSER